MPGYNALVDWILSTTLHNATQFLAVKSTKQRSKHDEFYGVGFAHERNSYVFRLSGIVLNKTVVPKYLIFLLPPINRYHETWDFLTHGQICIIHFEIDPHAYLHTCENI